MKIIDVQKCSFQNWYQDFKKVTIKSLVLPLPDEIVQYILKDGVILPKNNTIEYTVAKNSSDEEDSEEDSWDDDEGGTEAEVPHFPEFDARVRDAIEELGGKVFPKLNWSSPRDASWIALNNNCCCDTPAEIYLLLKSSDFVVHDLTERFTQCEDYTDGEISSEKPQQCVPFFLVLRKWISIDASAEFRCFVKDKTLIGICQREESLYFDHIGKVKEEIAKSILQFFENHILSKFPCDNYVFDVFRTKTGKVYLMDFNPFGSVTDALLFSWTELSEGAVKVDDTGLPEFRHIADRCGVRPNTLRQYALPKDIIDISTGQDSHKLVDLMKAKIEEQNRLNRDESSDDEELWKV